MNQVDWVRVKEIFYSALDHSAGDIDTFLTAECAGDAALRHDVEILLQSYNSGFLEKPLSFSEITEPRFKSGDTFGHYIIQRLIGRGGMGEVYLAEDCKLKRQVALKILTVRLSTVDAVTRFRLEARLASRIRHSSVATVFEFGEIGEYPFIAIEFIDGETLRELISSKSLSYEQIELVSASVAAGLKAAHDLGIVHRDIKPENIVVKPDGSVAVLDFGLAKIVNAARYPFNDTMLETVPGLLVGTSAYMSPEQIRGQSTNIATDFWSFGVVLYEMLAGRRPFVGATSSDVWASILRDRPMTLPKKAGDLAHIVERCLHKDPMDRYASANELIEALEKAKTGNSRSKFYMRSLRSGGAFAGTIALTAAIGGPIAYNNLSEIQQYGAAIRQEIVTPGPYTESTGQGFERSNSIGMKFVYIPPGEFLMGSSDGQEDEKPVRRVVIPEGFWMSKYEVTQEQYESVTGVNPSETKGCPDCPVDNILWYKAKELIWQLNAKNDDFVYSLPSEAEWEYAARAGTTGMFSGKLDDIGWYLDNSNYRQHPVGRKSPNAFGLHDMHGNVWEWCEDIYRDDYNEAPTDGSANISSGNPDYRVLRGGSARNDQSWARSARRLKFGPNIKFLKNDFGIRVVARIRIPS